MQALTDRPAYVRFEHRSVEDRNASIEAGHPVLKEVAYALVTPAGSKDVIERVATEWFASLRKSVDNGRFPAEWFRNYQAVYDAWLKDEEPPLNGTPLSAWPGLTKVQYQTLRDLRILTIEDVAAMNEEAIARMGMGGRALKLRATDFLASINDVAKVAERASALEVENATLRAQLKDLATKLEGLIALQGQKVTQL